MQWLAIRRACRHFNFFCVSTQFVMLRVRIFSSTHLALLFMYSKPAIRLCLMCFAVVDGVFLTRAVSSFPNSFASSLISSSWMSFPSHSALSFFSYVSLCLNDETKHSALVVRSIFRVLFVVVHVPAPYVIVGVTTASTKCNLCRSR